MADSDYAKAQTKFVAPFRTFREKRPNNISAPSPRFRRERRVFQDTTDSVHPLFQSRFRASAGRAPLVKMPHRGTLSGRRLKRGT
jgi:hypothetical protein